MTDRTCSALSPLLQWELGLSPSPGAPDGAQGWLVTDACPFLPRVSDKPALGLLREGLKLFISHFLLRGAPEAGALRERARLCTQALQGRGSLRM